MQARRAIVAFVALGAASAARPAVAAEPDAPVVASLAVAGSPDCAGRADVVKLIARRSARIRFADSAAGGPELRVVVDAAAPRAVSASLAIAWPNGSRSERRLTAPTCAETADAIALVIVLALDPAAVEREAAAPASPPRTASPPTPPRTASPPASPRVASPPPRAETAPSRDRTAAEPIAEKPAAPAPPARADETPPAPPPEPPSSPEPAAVVTRPAPEPSPAPVYRYDVGAAARLARGPTPSLMPGVALAAGWERDTSSIWSWKLQLIAAHYQRGSWGTSFGTVDFALNVVTLNVCPLRIGPSGVRARLCASSAAGRLAIDSRDNLTPRTASRPFFGVGGAALLTVAPHPRVELSASVEPQATLVRDTYSFTTNQVYEVPVLALFFGLGASITFP